MYNNLEPTLAKHKNKWVRLLALGGPSKCVKQNEYKSQQKYVNWVYAWCMKRISWGTCFKHANYCMSMWLGLEGKLALNLDVCLWWGIRPMTMAYCMMIIFEIRGYWPFTIIVFTLYLACCWDCMCTNQCMTWCVGQWAKHVKWWSGNNERCKMCKCLCV